MSAPTPAFPTIQGHVIKRPVEGVQDPSWQAHVYGYAASNYQSIMNPAVIAYVESIEDVQKVVAYATENDIAIACRSGSHHYLGACSTTGNNVQIDLSSLMAKDPSTTPWQNMDIDINTGLVTLGPGVSLGILAVALSQAGLWVPFGECSSVFAGGHCQSGGSSPCQWTIGGYLVDHITSYTVVVASGEVKTVYRDVTKNKTEVDSELFWCLAGASPGNFGVVTSITIQAMFDSDWDPIMEFSSTIDPKTGKLYRNMGRYTKERLERVMTLWAKCGDELNLPYDQQILPKGAKFAIGQMATSDSNVKHHDPTDDAVKSFEGGKFFSRAERENQLLDPPLTAMKQVPEFMNLPLFVCGVLVFIKKDLPEAEKAALKAKAMSFFALLDEALDWGILTDVAYTAISVTGSIKKVWKEAVCAFLPHDHADCKEWVSPSPATSMSGAALANTHFIEKEHLRKWEKMNVYGGVNSETGKPMLYDAATKTSKWAQFISNEYDKVEGVAGIANDLKADVSCILGGPGRFPPKDGRNFAAFRAGPSLSWSEITTWWGNTEEDERYATEWMDNIKANTLGPNGNYATKQMMNLALPWGSNQIDTPELRYAYWENEETYQRVLKLKKAVDPNWTFTPNPFGIGASDPAAQKHVLGK